jgi:hypothetical protein
MKTRGQVRGAAALLVCGVVGATQAGCYIDAGYMEMGPPPVTAAPAPVGEVTVADFYEPLAAYGGWVEVAPYGNVWVPSDEVVGEGFTPYGSGGQWVSTDQGWVFQSQWDNEWGWATYHYGRWLYTEAYGWAWVPDVEWGPAWVDWRYGGAYVGWAPLPPVGVMLMAPTYVFVETRYLAEPGAYRYRVPAQHVAVVYGATAPSPEHAMHGGSRWSLGPPAAHVAAAGVSVQPVHYSVPARGEIRARGAAVSRGRGGTRTRSSGGHPRSRRR